MKNINIVEVRAWNKTFNRDHISMHNAHSQSERKKLSVWDDYKTISEYERHWG